VCIATVVRGGGVGAVVFPSFVWGSLILYLPRGCRVQTMLASQCDFASFCRGSLIICTTVALTVEDLLKSEQRVIHSHAGVLCELQSPYCGMLCCHCTKVGHSVGSLGGPG
jgi:hypothetical protein